MTEALKQEDGFSENTKVQDKNGNVFIVPSGFKIATKEDDDTIEYDDPDNPTVQDGIVIEDVTAGGKGNQFVWVPVGNIKNGATETTINLTRRVFETSTNEQGKCTVKEEKTDGSELKLTGWDADFLEETSGARDQRNFTNAIAMNIEEFKTSVATNGGYYLARFEASKGTGETEVKSVMGVDPWDIRQQDAPENCQKMYVYNSDTQKYQSDLVNSYAWDTAIYYIQECSGDTDYARQSGESKTSEIGKTGENILNSTKARDQRCNICDMAGNIQEWSTETSTYEGDHSCVPRGGDFYFINYDASYRNVSEGDGGQNRERFPPNSVHQVRFSYPRYPMCALVSLVTGVLWHFKIYGEKLARRPKGRLVFCMYEGYQKNMHRSKNLY